MIRWGVFDTPFGPAFLAASARGVVRLRWGVEDPEPAAAELRESFPLWGVEREPEALEDAAEQLLDYFAGSSHGFDVEVDLTGTTTFQREVLTAVREVPYGETVTYGELAERLDRPGAGRAVGSALGENPVPIVVPCHRVVRADGRVGGYTAGTGYKEQLLELEACVRG